MSSGSGGGSGGGSRKLAFSLSREYNYEKHNLNSSMRENLSREDKRQMKIEKLKLAGVSKEQLRVVYPVPDTKLRQGDQIDPLVTKSSGLVNLWAVYRVNFFYTKVFGEGTDQDKRNMQSFVDHIEKDIAPKLKAIQSEIRLLDGNPLFAPPFFNVPLEKVEMPVMHRKK